MATTGTYGVAPWLPDGTSVNVYPRSGWHPDSTIPGNPPLPAAIGGPYTVTNGVITPTGLTDGTAYLAGAQVGGVWTYVRFVTDKALGSETVLGTVAVSSSALPTGAATAAKQPAVGTAGAAAADVLSMQGIAGGTPAPVSAASLPLPAGAATAAKQPALGTAGAAASDVISVQGIASGVAQPVDTELPAAVAASDALANPTAPQVLAHLMGWDGFNTQWKRLGVGTGFGDTITGGNSLALLNYLFGGSTWDRQRNPVIFKSFASTAITAGTGATIWTPAAGKKFRIMGYMISSSVAGLLIFGDNAVGTVIARSAAVAAAGIAQLGAGDMGNGILSAAANNVLKLDGPTGNVAGMVWGTEE